MHTGRTGIFDSYVYADIGPILIAIFLAIVAITVAIKVARGKPRIPELEMLCAEFGFRFRKELPVSAIPWFAEFQFLPSWSQLTATSICCGKFRCAQCVFVGRTFEPHYYSYGSSEFEESHEYTVAMTIMNDSAPEIPGFYLKRKVKWDRVLIRSRSEVVIEGGDNATRFHKSYRLFALNRSESDTVKEFFSDRLCDFFSRNDDWELEVRNRKFLLWRSVLPAEQIRNGFVSSQRIVDALVTEAGGHRDSESDRGKKEPCGVCGIEISESSAFCPDCGDAR